VAHRVSGSINHAACAAKDAKIAVSVASGKTRRKVSVVQHWQCTGMDMCIFFLQSLLPNLAFVFNVMNHESTIPFN
jgi:hypothetical protein